MMIAIMHVIITYIELNILPLILTNSSCYRILLTGKLKKFYGLKKMYFYGIDYPFTVIASSCMWPNRLRYVSYHSIQSLWSYMA